MGRLVIGLGHPDRGDDDARVLVTRRLTSVPSVARSDRSDLMDLWEGEEEVTVIDAIRSGRHCRTIRRHRRPITDPQFRLSRSFGLAEIVKLARAVDRLPARLDI